MTDSPPAPRIARHKPYYAELRQGRRYFWCACGLSKKQPYCDGSHKGTEFEPIPYLAEEDGEEVLFCGCKHTQTKPFCDGSHNNLVEEYETDDPNSESNRAIPLRARGPDGRTRLDGNCFVADMAALDQRQRGNLRYAAVISRDSGALFQSQFFFTVSGISPIVSFGNHDVLLFVARGQGELTISGRCLDIGHLSGAYIRPGEAFSLRPEDDGELRVYASVCPSADGPEWLDAMPDNFDGRQPVRVIAFDEENRTSMADRFFQVLVGEETGCTRATQFIGEIPFSKAAVHRHLYEEALIIVDGEGCMWTKTGKTPVAPGDVIFLPRKEAHSLQCTDPDGMLVAGVIYPGTNPSINY